MLIAQQQRVNRLYSVTSRLERSSGPPANTASDPTRTRASKEQQHTQGIVAHLDKLDLRSPSTDLCLHAGRPAGARGARARA